MSDNGTRASVISEGVERDVRLGYLEELLNSVQEESNSGVVEAGISIIKNEIRRLGLLGVTVPVDYDEKIARVMGRHGIEITTSYEGAHGQKEFVFGDTGFVEGRVYSERELERKGFVMYSSMNAGTLNYAFYVKNGHPGNVRNGHKLMGNGYKPVDDRQVFEVGEEGLKYVCRRNEFTMSIAVPRSPSKK
ncbi:hypothetical protein J4458_05050 [Candidatus Woesearchaeota archaeon]|nr:hypothetical protein [Candidatus Woesearchaeota archaeon]